MAAIALVGFWPTYVGPMLGGSVRAVPVVHIHAAVLGAWVALFIAQAALAAVGRRAVHVRLGRWIMVHGVLVIITGLVVTFERFGAGVAAGNLAVAQRRLFGPLRDLVVFAPFLWAGWHWRRKPEIHKRLMVVATTILLVAPVSRMAFLGQPVPEWLFLTVWPLPVYVAMAHDYITRRFVHPVYVLGVLALVLMRVVTPLRGSESWLAVSRWIASLYGF